ncbi:hypothetical protein VNO77_11869 [Canavalia gladiata]|uniref:Uncharacterized protein n=1 Tax=Canavalia gladiata TaxID=3824 RepID=A0AAN9LW29_CANGL
MKMSSSIGISILVLAIGCLNISAAFENNSVPAIPNLEAKSNNESKINILFLSLVNDMTPPYYDRLFFIGNFQPTPIELVPKVAWKKMTNFKVKSCDVYIGSRCLDFDLYNPKNEGNHQHIFWSVRNDGVYHSWDNLNWDKRAGWRTTNC